MTKPTTPKPIPIPRDLKPGDIIVLSNGDRRELRRYTDDKEEVVISRSAPAGLTVASGRGWIPENRHVFAVRIIRKTSKPARGDRDVGKWCVIVHCRSRAHAREALQNIDNGLRKLSIGRRDALGSYAIARRLSGEGKP